MLIRTFILPDYTFLLQTNFFSNTTMRIPVIQQSRILYWSMWITRKNPQKMGEETTKTMQRQMTLKRSWRTTNKRKFCQKQG